MQKSCTEAGTDIFKLIKCSLGCQSCLLFFRWCIYSKSGQVLLAVFEILLPSVCLIDCKSQLLVESVPSNSDSEPACRTSSERNAAIINTPASFLRGDVNVCCATSPLRPPGTDGLGAEGRRQEVWKDLKMHRWFWFLLWDFLTGKKWFSRLGWSKTIQTSLILSHRPDHTGIPIFTTRCHKWLGLLSGT